jgi:hypothetical protein
VITVAHDAHFGRIVLPPSIQKLFAPISLPGRPVRPRASLGEIGIFTAWHKRPVFREDGLLLRFDPLMLSITHNERVDAGASYQSRQVHGGGASPAAPSASAYFNVLAVANASLTKAKGDQSLGSTSANATTNEFTTVGLSRATADTPVGGDYTAPSTLGGQFTQVIKKTFTASGSGTAHGAGVFNSTTVSGSVLYVEDNFSSTAVLVSGDTLTVQASIQN